MNEVKTKEEVRKFYNSIGWQEEIEGFYQNARYEDLRPVSAEYISRCHLRVKRHIKPQGKMLLDAGSGPVQYPEYLTYSQDYQYRVCADISIVALKEARKRLGEKGLYVVTDVANLPFKKEAFDGLVSLHTLHHLQLEDQKRAYEEFFRVLKPASSAVVVNGWMDSPLMRRSLRFVQIMERLGKLFAPKTEAEKAAEAKTAEAKKAEEKPAEKKPTGTYIKKLDPVSLEAFLSEKKIKFSVFCWRSVNVRFMRAVVHRFLLGKLFLRLVYRLEEKYPEWMGKKGQYPLIVLEKLG